MPDQQKRRLSLSKLRQLLAPPELEPEHVAERIRFMEQKVVLATKVVCLLALAYLYFPFSSIMYDPLTFGELGFEAFGTVFFGYLVTNVIVMGLIVSMDVWPLGFVKGVVFFIALADGVLLSVLVSFTGGVESTVFWIYLFLIVRNAVSTPSAMYQTLFNVVIAGSYIMAGIVNHAYEVFNSPGGPADFGTAMSEAVGSIMRSHLGDVLVLRIVLMVAVAAASYAIQLLYEKQRLALLEAQELATRQQQLRSTGRLAAEIAHQLKNPLAIINNAAFDLQRSLKDSNVKVSQQVEMIREEIERADKIITELMGYAQLTEGRVEKLNLLEEIDKAVALVFPEGSGFRTEVKRNYSNILPPLLMQSAHLKEVLVNIMKNSREAMNGSGIIEIVARPQENKSILIAISDTGPGIPEHQLKQVFEPYFSTKDKGTGLGLAIVKHNAELYGGTVRAESVLGKGAKFILEFPSKALLPVES